MIKITNRLKSIVLKNAFQQLKIYTGIGNQKPQKIFSLYDLPSITELDGLSSRSIQLIPLDFKEYEMDYKILKSVKSIKKEQIKPKEQNLDLDKKAFFQYILKDKKEKLDKMRSFNEKQEQVQTEGDKFVKFLPQILLVLLLSVFCIMQQIISYLS
ncbi:hypothetical protein pb186bvf_018737 [Paramecium bursaria]